MPAGKKKERLDQYLTQCIPDISRSKIQRLIREGFVLVNGESVKTRHTVQPFERIEVQLPTARPAEALPEDIPLTIVYEDDSLLVIDKPAGMVVHPGSGNFTGTMVNALLGRGTALSGAPGMLRPGIVHRIDKETSGLLVVAKDDSTHRKLALQFEEKTATRLYESVVWTRITPGSGRIEAAIGRSTRDRKTMAVDSRGKTAVTIFTVLERFTFATYLQLKLETGRTHQIRVHMKHMGAPVFGDQTYGGRGSALAGLNTHDKAAAKEMLAVMTRQALHARTLGFHHPATGSFMEFSSDLPGDFIRLLNMMRHERRQPD
ncbi:RluA family pseudouridine synthase [bacterium]|nr:RluA family pseudouridine synthase [bacterium]